MHHNHLLVQLDVKIQLTTGKVNWNDKKEARYSSSHNTHEMYESY